MVYDGSRKKAMQSHPEDSSEGQFAILSHSPRPSCDARETESHPSFRVTLPRLMLFAVEVTSERGEDGQGARKKAKQGMRQLGTDGRHTVSALGWIERTSFVEDGTLTVTAQIAIESEREGAFHFLSCFEPPKQFGVVN